MTIDEAQRDSRRAYVGGGPGVLVSALVWLATTLAERARGVPTAFAVLFVGGTLIFPLATIVVRHGFGRAATVPANPLGATALESTIAMIGGLFAAWLFLPFAPSRVLPLAAIAVGTHYAGFRTVYGDRRFWVLAALVTAIGVVAVLRRWPAGAVPLAVAMIEGAMGILITVNAINPTRRS